MGEEPVRLDLIVIKKDPDEILTDPLGSTFRMYNLFEYKSPDDKLSIDEFCKAMAYALLYKSYNRKSDELPLTEMTLTIVRHRYPRELISSLKRAGFTVDNVQPGLYRIGGKAWFTTHIAVSSQMNKKDYMGLRLIAKGDLQPAEVTGFAADVKDTENENLKTSLSAIFRICFQANPLLLERIKEDENMRDPFMEWMNEVKEEGREEGRFELNLQHVLSMLRKKLSIDLISEITDFSCEKITDIARENGLTVVTT